MRYKWLGGACVCTPQAFEGKSAEEAVEGMSVRRVQYVPADVHLELDT